MSQGTPARITRRFLRVWQRNYTVYRRTWKISFVPPLLEPLLYIFAFGVGLGTLIGNVAWQGRELSYVQYIVPALIAISIMNSAFFETTYASFVRMYYQKTFDAMMATPLSVEEIITGEIAWGVTKSLISAVVMTAVVSLFGLIHYPSGLMIIPVAVLGGFAFSTIGMVFTGITPNIEMFNLPSFLFITPMFLFSATFFPIDGFPAWARGLALALPLTHLTQLARGCCLGVLTPELGWSCLYLAAMGAICFPLALARMRARLIP